MKKWFLNDSYVLKHKLLLIFRAPCSRFRLRTKISLMLSLLCLPLAFWACGDDGSSANGNSVAEEFEDSPSSSSWSENEPAPNSDSGTGSKSGSSRVIPSEVEGSVDYVWETADDKVNCKESRSRKSASPMW